jgi:NAD(P)-dependent dehydrogenase (short-subunit alcohol dehydrogenase family)
MDLYLKDKTALVTGSTAGIGLEIARKLAVEGAEVIVTGRSQAKLDQAVASIRASGGAHVSGVLADGATEEGAAALVRATPSVDILVNNLGIYEFGWPGRTSLACWSGTGAGSSSSPVNRASSRQAR